MSKIAVVAGATGLVGEALLRVLLNAPEYAEVRALTRRPLTLDHERLRCASADFEKLDEQTLRADDVYCCLGTTLRKAGSKAAFEQVDYHYVLNLARAARAAGVRQFLVVSAAGTSEAGAFYSRVKARMERDVSALGFASTYILRPSLLLGARAESRPGERLGQLLSPLISPLLAGPLRKYRPVSAEQVATALLTLARREQRGVHIQHLPLD